MFCCNTLNTDRRILYVPHLKVSVVRVLLTNVRGDGTMAAPPVTTPMHSNIFGQPNIQPYGFNLQHLINLQSETEKKLHMTTIKQLFVQTL